MNLAVGSFQQMRVTTRLLLMLLGLLVTSPALADNWKDCAYPTATNRDGPDRAIKGCSSLIKAGRETKKDLAIVAYRKAIQNRFPEGHALLNSLPELE